jgi:SAM-dependent methyltransferase
MQDHVLSNQGSFWNDWHLKINERAPNWGGHFPLAEQFLPMLASRKLSPILDLACGQCNDAIYFAERQFEVYAMDFSSVALNKARSAIEDKGIISIYLYERDISPPLPFEDGKFGAVYSHLGLHYFDDETTRSIFSEIRRVLRDDGLIAFNAKSIHDFRYGEGVRIGPDIYDYKGHIRHFFSVEYVKDILVEWHILVLEEYEERYGGSIEPSSFIKVIASKSAI